MKRPMLQSDKRRLGGNAESPEPRDARPDCAAALSNRCLEFCGLKFPDTAQKFPVLQNLFPDNSRRELREKSLRHSGFLLRIPSR